MLARRRPSGRLALRLIALAAAAVLAFGVTLYLGEKADAALRDRLAPRDAR